MSNIIIGLTLIVTQEQDYRLYHLVMVASFLLLDITVSCEPVNVPEVTRQLLFNYLLLLSVHNCYATIISRHLYGGLQRSCRLTGWQHNSPALIIHAYTAQPSCIVCLGRIIIVILDDASYCGPVRTVRPVQCLSVWFISP